VQEVNIESLSRLRIILIGAGSLLHELPAPIKIMRNQFLLQHTCKYFLPNLAAVTYSGTERS
jgi:hypothetical protein